MQKREIEQEGKHAGKKVKEESELEAPRGRKKESLMQKPRGYPAIPECFALTYFGISVSVFVSAAL